MCSLMIMLCYDAVISLILPSAVSNALLTLTSSQLCPQQTQSPMRNLGSCHVSWFQPLARLDAVNK
jgi:hypothetical protein